MTISHRAPVKLVPSSRLAPVTPDEATGHVWGTAWELLTPDRRRFVDEFIKTGGRDAKAAAVAAGFKASTAAGLKSNPEIIAAIRERADQTLRSSAILATDVLLDLAQHSANDSVRLKSAVELLNRAGLLVEHKQTIEVTHSVSTEKKIEEIASLAKALGLDPKAVLGQAGVEYTDAEFEDVTEEWAVGPAQAPG